MSRDARCLGLDSELLLRRDAVSAEAELMVSAQLSSQSPELVLCFCSIGSTHSRLHSWSSRPQGGLAPSSEGRPHADTESSKLPLGLAELLRSGQSLPLSSLGQPELLRSAPDALGGPSYRVTRPWYATLGRAELLRFLRLSARPSYLVAGRLRQECSRAEPSFFVRVAEVPPALG